jgi:hypothetical protein
VAVPTDPVPRALREELEAARACREDFGDAWPVALSEALKQVGNGTERRTWRKALNATRGNWASAYERGQPGRAEAALTLIGMERNEPAILRPCENCGGEIAGRHGGARYCSDRCLKRAGYLRRAPAAA